MPKNYLFLLVLFSSIKLGFAEEPVLPTLHVLPEDVIQETIEELPITLYQMTNKYAVRWTYTEAGARKMLSFWEEHRGQKVRMVLGHLERIGICGGSRSTSPAS